ncbi:hypothetical protein [Desulfosporosinus sp.]|uniref:hypothetical protein n=1 Tax=Desulfosporosinus sp. TaxID=157907 RepID=UPI0025BD7B75|nr:hypothetical protein [Desulfosporosinus sp.]MBC2724251.1 hypothetical protein [Desulfosporosinus sp.]MBC2727586.1 hypothetical protein [Desulfosporosinus sp.]
MNKIKKLGVIGLICCLVFIVISFISPTKLYGKWYLYNGSDINTDSNISKQLNPKDYIEISEGTKKEFRSDGKGGVAEFRVRGSKIYSGEAIFKYDVNKIGEHKILVLELIGYDNSHSKVAVQSGEEYTYVLDKNINFE